jgi:membrane associated rhomboid family serine protease
MGHYSFGGFIRDAKTHAAILTCLVGIMWTSECLDFFLGGALDGFGIVPREWFGLRGILFAPFLHGDFTHLITNSIPFIFLGWFVMVRRTSDFIVATAMAMLIGGMGTWLIASANTVHVGASGVVFGYLGFLVSRGYFERSLISVLFSIAVGATYGGLILGVLPGQPGISWEGHLFGFIGGVMAARFVAANERKRAENYSVR